MPVPLGDIGRRFAARRPPRPVRARLQKQPNNRLLPVVGRDEKWCATVVIRLVDGHARLHKQLDNRILSGAGRNVKWCATVVLRLVDGRARLQKPASVT